MAPPMKHAPSKLLRGIKVPQGKHASAVVISKGKKLLIRKTLSKNKNLTLVEGKHMLKKTLDYHRDLSERGVNVPRIESIKLRKNIKSSKPSYYLVSTDEFVGRKNAMDAIRNSSKKRALEIYSKVIGELWKAVSSNKKNPKNAAIPIDSVLRNFVMDKKGKVYFVDFYPPKAINASGRVTPFIPRLHEAPRGVLTSRYGDKRGIFLFLLSKAIEARPDLRSDFEMQTKNFLQERGETKVVSFLDKSKKRNYSLRYFKRKK